MGTRAMKLLLGPDSTMPPDSMQAGGIVLSGPRRSFMALVPIKTASETGYCDCICGCYELASLRDEDTGDRKSTRLNSSHTVISYAVFCLKKKKRDQRPCNPEIRNRERGAQNA